MLNSVAQEDLGRPQSTTLSFFDGVGYTSQPLSPVMTLEELHAHQDQVDQKLLRLVSQVVSHVPGGRETFCTHLGTVPNPHQTGVTDTYGKL